MMYRSVLHRLAKNAARTERILFSTARNSPVRDEKKLLRELCAKIRFSGPITTAEYMREVLVNPGQGFYLGKDIIGPQGHFVTSPEISQMFGECVAIWILNEWMKMGEPKPLNLVELGPGRGTLLNDILRTVAQLRPDLLQHTAVHLVEVSPEMRQLQEATLCGQAHSAGKQEKNTISKFGPGVTWHGTLREVPKAFSIFIAHEFFDALPVHKFQRTEGGWREVLIDIEPESEEPKLRYIISRNETPACHLLDKFETRQQMELCPQAGILAKNISDRIVEFGGLALIADYGHMGEKGDTFRAFRHHKQVDPLLLPGMADITADVDFNYLSKQISEDSSWHGPLEQGDFLHATGILTRCEQLLSSAGEREKDDIISAYHTLTDKDKMGSSFKFAAVFPKTMAPIHDKYPPVGFSQSPVATDGSTRNQKKS